MTIGPDTITAILTGVITLIMMGAIPWAFKVQARLAIVETLMKMFVDRVTQVEAEQKLYATRLHEIHVKIDRISNWFKGHDAKNNDG